MHRIDAPGATQDNRFTEGDPAAGSPATQVSAAFMNALMDEIANVIQAAGLTLNGSEGDAGNQLLQALTGGLSQGQNIAVFDSAGITTWQVPDVLKKGLRKARVTVVGAGGGGGAGDSGYVGEEGASGGAAIRMVDLTGVDAVQITIGLRGSSRTSAQGSSGGSSSFGPYFSATGGEGGRPGPHVEAAEAGRGIGGDINIDGNAGSATHESTELGKQPRPGRPGPLGGGSSGGQRLGSGDTVNNRNGRFAGASGAGGTSPNTAGSGKDGMVIVEW
ncbi:glycine-rich domain-containing protein [Salinicola avicenniae]|uniref:glycine-rich domain-containing protein n=1 Tax=Salinicola avicenniae TaxID=2916836 RepID=UPI0020744A50|nr:MULTISPECIES: hypothetical protein [unclassified Salinicola]